MSRLPLNLDTAMQKSLFLLGAGASFGTGELRTGCKMSSEMFDELQAILKNPDRTGNSRLEAEALRFLSSTLHYQSKWRSLSPDSKFKFAPNIEELALIIRRIKNRDNYLPYPLTGNWADKLVQLESQYSQGHTQSLFERLEIKLKNELLPTWLKINQDSLDYLQPLARIMNSQAVDKPIEIFTLNYDETIELYLEKKHEVKPYCGFVSGEWKGPDEADVEGFDKLNLYKLHGSLNWVRLRDSGEVKEYGSLQEEEINDIDERHKPYIIFGHGTKTFSFEPFFSLIAKFKKTLFERTYIFAIGYSFFDPYINNLIIEALNRDPFKKLIIVNPKFGPEIQEAGRLHDYHNVLEINGQKASIALSEYIEEVQKDSFYSEQPEFNIQKINGDDNIRFMKIGFDQFLSHYFENNGAEFISLIDQYESIKAKQEYPF